MVLDAVANFVRGRVAAAVDDSQTTVSVDDASVFPDPSTDGEFNVVLWDANNFPRPDQDADVEVMRVTAVDTGTDELTVTRAQETTTAAAHPSGSAVHLSPTAKMFSDVEDTFADFWDDSAQTLTANVDNESVSTEQVNRLKVDTRNNNQFTSMGVLHDDFEDLSSWTATEGSLSADTTNFFRGTQSAKLSPSSGNISIEKNVDLDLTEQRPAIAVRGTVDSDITYEKFNIFAEDSTGDAAQFQVTYRMGADAGFRYHQMGIAFTQGTPDLSDIVKLRIAPNAVDSSAVWWVDGLRLTPAPKPGKLVIDFDGFRPGLENYVEPVMGEYGYPAYVSGRISLIDDSMETILARLRDEKGWYIGPHTLEGNQLTSLTPEQQREDFEKAKAKMLELGHHAGAAHRDYSQDNIDQSAYEMAHEYHKTGRGLGGAGHGVPCNPMTIPSRKFDDGLTTEIERELDNLAEYGGYWRMYGHTDDRLTEPDLRAVMDKVQTLEQQGKIEVISIEEAYRQWQGYLGNSANTKREVVGGNKSDILNLGPTFGPVSTRFIDGWTNTTYATDQGLFKHFINFGDLDRPNLTTVFKLCTGHNAGDGETVTFQVYNLDDNEEILSFSPPTGGSGAVESPWVAYTPSGSGPRRIQIRYKTDTGTNTSIIDSPNLQVGYRID